MTKQVDEGWRGGKREMRLEREENAKLYHWLLVDTWSHTCRTVAAQMSSRTVLSWRGAGHRIYKICTVTGFA